MPDQNPHHGRRPPFHRGPRRGPDRRGTDRRTPPNAPEQPARDHVDVEQIMRDIRARISQRHGIDLSTQQIQELAARRLEAILDPRNIKPSLLEQLRRNAGEAPDTAATPRQSPFEFEDSTLFETHRGVVRFFRRLLNPLLKLLFNPTPLSHALNAQARFNKELLAREAEREQRQVEWNALHYELLQRLVTEGARASLETQSLALRVEALAAKVDFNERRVRGIESTVHVKPPSRPVEPVVPSAPAAPETSTTTDAPAATEPSSTDAPRRKRRRRRGRRSGGGGMAAAMGGGAAAATDTDEAGGPDAEDDNGVDGGEETEESSAADAVESQPWTPPPPAPPVETPAPEPPPTPVAEATATEPSEPLQPAPPRDEPVPPAPVDHADPGPPDR